MYIRYNDYDLYYESYILLVNWMVRSINGTRSVLVWTRTGNIKTHLQNTPEDTTNTMQVTTMATKSVQALTKATHNLYQRSSATSYYCCYYAAEAWLPFQHRWLSIQLYSTGLGHGHSLKLRQHNDVQNGDCSSHLLCSMYDSMCRTTQHIAEVDVTTIHRVIKKKNHLTVHQCAYCSVAMAKSLLTA